MACIMISVRSYKVALKWPRFWSKTNWKRFQRSWRWILGEKQFRGYHRKFWNILSLEIRGQCGSVATKSLTLICIYGDCNTILQYVYIFEKMSTFFLLSTYVCSYIKTNGLFQYQTRTRESFDIFFQNALRQSIKSRISCD